jgi:hypothetical protein
MAEMHCFLNLFLRNCPGSVAFCPFLTEIPQESQFPALFFPSLPTKRRCLPLALLLLRRCATANVKEKTEIKNL